MAGNFKVNFKPERFNASLARLQANFGYTMLTAARNIMRHYMTDVINMTPQPGQADEGFNKEYVRTGRLAGGWSAAAAGLGIPIAFGGDESDYREMLSEEAVHLVAENQVPYAPFVEHVGPWLIPPNAPGGPKWRGGRHMVENARNNVLGSGIIALYVGNAWKAII